MFARAIESDPNYARAWAGLSDCHSFLQFYWQPTRENLEGADTASRKALELDSELAEAHAWVAAKLLGQPSGPTEPGLVVESR